MSAYFLKHHHYTNATQQGTVGNDQLSHVPSRKLHEEGLELYLEKIEKEILMNALNLTHWNRTLAAKKLGMSFRSLRYRLKKFGLDGEDDSV